MRVGGLGRKRYVKNGEGEERGSKQPPLLPIFKYGCHNEQIMKLSREEILHIARLARLGLTETELDRFREQLSDKLLSSKRMPGLKASNISSGSFV